MAKISGLINPTQSTSHNNSFTTLDKYLEDEIDMEEMDADQRHVDEIKGGRLQPEKYHVLLK